MHVRLLSGQVFSHFGELWLAGSHGGGITSGMSYRNWQLASHLLRNELYRDRSGAVGTGGSGVA